LLLPVASCIQKFEPTLSSPPSGYLVVEAIVNTGGGPASITLTRTTNLSDTSIVYESGAMVQVEGNDNSIFPFAAQTSGVYGVDQLTLNSLLQYRLRIKTSEGEEYLSDFAPVQMTPPIDSINWQVTSGGLQVYANTHDPLDSIHYYKWDYAETWEYNSPYIQTINYDTVGVGSDGLPILGIAFLPEGNDSSIYTCWQSDQSTAILLGSSAALSSDVIADFPIVLIPQTSIKLTNEYSILVHQYALTQGAFNFLQIMKSNTEETGSIFSPQPSQLQGNIHCLTNPTEIVVGYVSFCPIQSERIFIYNFQLPHFWSQYNSGCSEDSVYIVDPANRFYPQDQISGAQAAGLIPTRLLNVNRFLAAPPPCVDCTISGTNQKPTFWQ
jgi:hypothetical protein